MALPNIFTAGVADLIIDRINNLKPSSHANWGKMKVSQMLAHCNVTYEMTFENIHPKPNAFLKFILKMIVKNKVVTDFDNRESHSFGKLSKTEWSNMFYKHLDHHLTQFGV